MSSSECGASVGETRKLLVAGLGGAVEYTVTIRLSSYFWNLVLGAMFSFLPSCSNLNLLVFLYTWPECKANNQRAEPTRINFASSARPTDSHKRAARPTPQTLETLAEAELTTRNYSFPDSTHHFKCAVNMVNTWKLARILLLKIQLPKYN